MTGFGKCQVAEDGRQVHAEVRSVNHRFLDLSLRIPRLLVPYEQKMRELLKNRLGRGHVEVYMTYASDAGNGAGAVIDMARVSSYADAASRIAKAVGIENNFGTAELLQMGDVLSFEADDEEAAAAGRLALEALTKALDEVTDARQREGDSLWEDILMRADKLEELASRIETREPEVVREYRDRLSERVGELMPEGAPIDEQRIAQEIAIFADRCNVTEEVIRVRSHLSRLREAGNAGGPQGRNLDFIAQELNREFNTIGSKSQDCDVTNCVLDAKTEVEKIREQIQNIE